MKEIVLDKRIAKLGLALSVVVPSMTVYAEETVNLNEITVKGEAMEESNKSFTVNVVDREQLEQRNIDDALRAIEETPGMTMSAGAYAQGGVASAFQIRGFAGGGHGSDAAIYIDGISLNEGGSHGDGYADTNIIMPIEIDTLSIYKGPVSALFGNFARGGTLAFETRKGGDYQEVDLFGGSYNTVNAQMAMGGSVGPLYANFAVQSYDNDGYREHQEYSKQNAAGRVAYEIDDNTEIALSLRNHSGHFNAPGYMREALFESGEKGRRGREDTAEDDGGERHLTSYRLDYNTMLNDTTRLLVYTYGVEQDSVRYAKFNYNSTVDDEGEKINRSVGQSERRYSRNGIGLGASLNGETSFIGKPTSWVVGVEYFDETTDAQRFNTQDRVRMPDANGDIVTQNRELTTETTSLFAQVDIAVTDKFTPTLGLRFDSFDGDQRAKPTAGRVTTTTSSMEDYSHFSPKLGARYDISSNWQLRGSVVNGYALPPGEFKYMANIDVDPVDYWQYELGFSGSPTPQWFVDFVAFQLDASGEYREEGDRYFNHGETTRTGLEGEVRFNPASNLEFIALLGLFDSEVTKGENKGKAITNVPKHMTTLKANYTPPTGLGGTLTWRSIGEYYITGTNNESYEGFDVVDMTIFYNIKGSGTDGDLKVYAQINNVLDETYAEAVWYSSDYRTANYAPAAARNFGVGLTMKF